MQYDTIWGDSESERGMLRGVPMLLLGTILPKRFNGICNSWDTGGIDRTIVRRLDLDYFAPELYRIIAANLNEFRHEEPPADEGKHGES